MRVSAFALAAGMLALSGCALWTSPDVVGPVDEIMFLSQPDTCGLAAVAGLKGKPFTLLAEQPLVGPLRVIWPGQEVMSGLVARRLNVQVSDDGRIIRLSCG